jgi:hypothetical protein
MRSLMTVGLVVLISGCRPEGPTRMVSVKVQQARVGAAGFELVDRTDRELLFWSDAGSSVAVTEDAERFQVFEVPQGPALFQFGFNRFVYSAGDRLLPCDVGLSGSSTPPDAGLEFDLTFDRPVEEHDTLELVTAGLPWLPERFTALDAGITTLQQRVGWRSRTPLVGPVTVLHHVKGDSFGEFDRFTVKGILDAGTLEGLSENPVQVRGVFEPVPVGPQRMVSWDSESLAAIQRNAFTQDTRFSLLRGDLRVASVRSRGKVTDVVPMLMPALEPDTVLVEGNVLTLLDADEPWFLFFGWRLPLSGPLEMKLRTQPPEVVQIAPDGLSMGWTRPATRPNVYIAKLLKPIGRNSLAAEVLATFVTDQELVPIPAHLRKPNMFVELTSVYAEGASASTCAFHIERFTTWAQVPAVSPRWFP